MKEDLATLIQLAASGNSRTVEERWMAALERRAGEPEEVASWAPLLEELANRDRAGEAEPLAWAAIEAVQERSGPREALKVAGPFLLALHKSDDLRMQVAEIYTTAYADRQHLQQLLEESGIAGGRPVRRALRILDVGLNVEPGAALIARHEHSAVRVVSIEPDTWAVTLETAGGRRTLGPVELADEYAVADPNDFRVLRQFEPQRLGTLLANEPARIVISILRSREDRIDSDVLKNLLTPDPIPADEWSRWWTKARAALKGNPNVQIQGRAPYELSYHEVAVTLEYQTEARLRTLHDPADQLACIEDYLRQCKSLGRDPDREMMARVKSRMDKLALRQIKAGSPGALAHLLASQGVALAMGADQQEADRPTMEFLAAAADPKLHLRALVHEPFWPAAWRCLKAAYPTAVLAHGEALLPQAPAGACDMLARDLMAGGFDRSQFEAMIQRIVQEPLTHVHALAWLWLGPDPDLDIPRPPLTTLCSKLLSVAGELRRREELSREVKKCIHTRVRDALSADQYARFKECLQQTHPGVAASWRTQIARLDGLGRAVPEDLVKLIRAVFPEEPRTARILPWKRLDVLYMTAHGRDKLMGEIDELVNVKMRANAKAIGEAASHGDLSENSEYKFALEERDLLRARLAVLQGQAEQAVVLEPQDVPGDHVGFGSRVTLRRTDNGETLEMTFLGTWEADVDQSIYNYQSPVGQQLMGLTSGETVELRFGDRPGVYAIERIENALA